MISMKLHLLYVEISEVFNNEIMKNQSKKLDH